MLWRLALGRHWRIGRNRLLELLLAREGGTTRDVIVAPIGKQVVGFVCVQANPETREGNLVALAVLPLVQRRGVGTGLYQTALQYFRQYGVETITLGQGTPRIWPGVPHVDQAALVFFESLGWRLNTPTFDMFTDLRDWQTPPELQQAIRHTDLRYATATPNTMPAVLDMLRSTFPQRLPRYRTVAELGDLNNILLAMTPTDEVVGALITYSQRSHPSRRDAIWQEEFGLDLGGISALAVREEWQAEGVEAHLVARAHELLRWQGVGFCLVGATYARDFFKGLGYKVWQAYDVAEKRLE